MKEPEQEESKIQERPMTAAEKLLFDHIVATEEDRIVKMQMDFIEKTIRQVISLDWKAKDLWL